jgi:hypothetical protein
MTAVSQSMLDWYFDCDGEQHSLQEMLKHPLTSVPAAGGNLYLFDACLDFNIVDVMCNCFGRITFCFAAPRSGGGANMQASALLPEKLPETSSPKLERYTKFNAPDSDYFCFQLHLQLFRDKIQHLAAHCPNDPKEPECEEKIIWRRRKFFGLDRGPKHDVWLALGWLENGFHKPVAVKRNDESPKDKAKLKFIMRRLKPGSFIASAEFVEIEPLVLEGDDDEEEEEEKHSSNGEEGAPVLQRQQSDPRQFRWVSEAGVCTLEELFGRKLNPNDKIERNTKAHRILVKEILHCMALAVFHLHECRIAHCCISLRYFKVFLIQEPPRSTNLRVKLVSMRKANILTSVDERTDIEALGHAMARVILGLDYDSANASSIEQLLQYDPALYWLISWILDKTNGATLADVIRHPYFMSLNEKEVFTLALAGGVFGQILSAAEVRIQSCSTYHRMVYLLHTPILHHCFLLLILSSYPCTAAR